MATIQTFQKYDCSSLSNFKDWAQAIGSSLSSLGWVQASDTSPASQVNWANVVDVPANNVVATSSFRFLGTWSSGTSYSATSGNDHVTYDPGTGATCFQCINKNSGTLSAVNRQTAQSLAITSVDAVSAGKTVYHGTITGGGSNAYQNWWFTVSGTDNPSNNDGSFYCSASTATTITLVNPNGAAETSGGTPTCVSSANTCYYTWSTTIPGFGDSDFAGQSFTISGFTGANNGTFTCVASGTPSGQVFTVTNASGFVQSATGAIVCLTAPDVSSKKKTPQWAPYYYEIWRTNDALNATSPIYLRFVYYSGNTAVNGSDIPAPRILFSACTNISSGFPAGNVFNGAASPIEKGIAPTASAGGSATYECDFCGDAGSFSMHMWRARTSGTWTLIVDRGKNSAGVSVDTFFTVCSVSGGAGIMQQQLFKASAGTRCPNNADISWNSIGGSVTSYAQNGLVPAFPIFPIVGYLANPILGGITLATADVAADGMQFAIANYGASHTYMASTQNTVNSSGSRYPAILWE